MFDSKLKGQAPFQMQEEDNRGFETGQAVVEYLLIFAALLVITIVSVSTFYPRVKETTQGVFIAAAEKIVYTDGAKPKPGVGEQPGITLKKGDIYRDFRFRPGEVKLFKFRASAGPGNRTLTVVAEVQSHYSDGNLHVMAKYAGQNWQIGPPSGSDYSSIQKIIKADLWAYKGVHNGVYYYMTRHLTKHMSINYPEQIIDGCWYVWVKNIGDFWLQDCWIHFGF